MSKSAKENLEIIIAMDVKIVKLIVTITFLVCLMIGVIAYRVSYHARQLFWLEQDVQRLKWQSQVNAGIARYDTMRIDTMFIIAVKPPRTNYVVIQDSVMMKLYGKNWRRVLETQAQE